MLPPATNVAAALADISEGVKVAKKATDSSWFIGFPVTSATRYLQDCKEAERIRKEDESLRRRYRFEERMRVLQELPFALPQEDWYTKGYGESDDDEDYPRPWLERNDDWEEEEDKKEEDEEEEDDDMGFDLFDDWDPNEAVKKVKVKEVQPTSVAEEGDDKVYLLAPLRSAKPQYEEQDFYITQNTDEGSDVEEDEESVDD